MARYRHKSEEATASRTRNYEGGDNPQEEHIDIEANPPKPKRKKPKGWKNMTRAERRRWRQQN